MLKFLIILGTGFIVLSISEFIRRRLHIANESSRKTYHVVHGLIMAIAPFLISYNTIIVVEMILLVEMIIVRKFNLLPWLYKVGRLSWGEFFGVAGPIVLAMMRPNAWIFCAAMLHLGIADAVAALVGKKYGQKTSYKIFGQTKSLMGSLAFYVVSLAITGPILYFVFPQAFWPLIVLLPPLVTLAENVSIFGSDNIVIPLVVAIVLTA